MNPDTVLKLQSYLDDELSADETREITEWLSQNPDAQALFRELKSTKELLLENEPDAWVPETREFYWSKIERQISGDAAVETPNRRSLTPSWLLRWLTPVAAACTLAILGVVVFKPGFLPRQIASYFHEIDIPLEEDDAISFHSQEAGMTVVWIAAK